MRSFLIGLALVLVIPLTLLSLRPGGLRQQLRFAARRFRILLVLGGIYVVVTTAMKLVFREGPVVDYGPPLTAVFLLAVFLVVGRDPKSRPRLNQ